MVVTNPIAFIIGFLCLGACAFEAYHARYYLAVFWFGAGIINFTMGVIK